MAGSIALSATAQETYQSAELAKTDLNGTARYVGMGGAMEALGADISTMGTNPAGIGLFRRSMFNASVGIQSVSENNIANDDAKQTTFGFDQMGFVVSTKTGVDSYLNVGINYHKSRNFNQLFNAANTLNGASQNKVSRCKYVDGDMNVGWASESIIDALYDESMLYNLDGRTGNYSDYLNASDYRMQKLHSGYISDFDFNISGNSHNRWYYGVTIGLRDVHYDCQSLYRETLLSTSDDITSVGDVEIEDSRLITGIGVNAKFGIIFRPVETSPFRIGAYIHTPTMYNLTTRNYTIIYNDVTGDDCSNESAYDFHLNTPWVFGLSLGHTVSNILALGATYEFSDYGAIDNRVITGSYADYYDGYYNDVTASDRAMNLNTDEVLRGVHTLKLGAEIKALPVLAIRLGYNFLSPMYEKDGYRDHTIESYGTAYSSTTDYTNWDATHRVTFGLGFTTGHFNVDLAYQYRQTNGTFFPFHGWYYDNGDEYNNVATGTKISDKRHQVLLTLGYRF